MLNSPLVPVNSGGMALPSSAHLTPFFQIGSRTAIQTTSGNVGAIFALENYDKRLEVATYSLRIMNDSPQELLCRVWAVASNGEAMAAYPLPIKIAPFSLKATTVPVRVDEFDSFQRAIAEISGGDLHCTVEAAAPIIRRKRALVYPLTIAASLLFVLALGVGNGVAGAIPRIAAFAAPPTASLGSTVEAQYTVFGKGDVSYRINSPDGKSIASGLLAKHSGVIPMTLPINGKTGPYVMHLSMRGNLGNDNDVRIVNAVPPRTLSGAQVEQISVDPIVAKPGETVRVLYSAKGDSGYVQLRNPDGSVWAQQPYSKTGVTLMQLPSSTTNREMQVVLHVRQGDGTAESSAGVIVAPAQPAVVAKAPVPAAEKTANTSVDGSANAAPTDADAGENGTFSVATPSVKSGATVKVNILSPRNGMRMSISDTQSHEITGVNVSADQDTVSMRAPIVKRATKYVVVATFADGFGQEVIVSPITVAP